MTAASLPGLTPAQLEIIASPPTGKIFLEGPAGAGKTTVGVERLVHLLEAGVPGGQVLVLVPQRALSAPYSAALHTPGLAAGGLPEVVTIGGLAKRMVELFWPLAAEQAGFARPDRPPTFLTLETAQYYMAHLVRPKLDEGYFESVVIDRNRLYSQIIDNLNKAAMNEFSYTEIAERLKAAWVGELAQLRVYEDAQECARLFRAYCLAHNLLDFSLQVDVFMQQLWGQPFLQEFLRQSYRHILVDNLEENPPVAHHILRDWLPECDSALLIFDQDAGYRLFLGADPQQAYSLSAACESQVTFSTSFVTNPPLEALGRALGRFLRLEEYPEQPLLEQPPLSPRAAGQVPPDPALALSFSLSRYYPQMLDTVTAEIAELVQQGTPPGEIVVLAPFLSDALRFSLTYRLEGAGIPVRAYRPSRALREESAARSLLTLAELAHPEWDLLPPRDDFAAALLQAVQGLDLVRARLLAEIVYRPADGEAELTAFERITPAMQARITFLIGERYEKLRAWLRTYAEGAPEALDHFLARLFGEVLSQPGFGFHADFKAAEVTANLIESIQKFRWAAADPLAAAGIPLGREYVHMVQDGVIAAAYVESMLEQPEEAVFLAPAYTFLMQNRAVEYQIWLDVGSRSWFERIAQPLTHPYVLSQRWPKGQPWNQVEEERTSREAMARLALGLIRRCRGRIHLGLSQLNEQGYESRGPLLRGLDRVLRSFPAEAEA
ncbi:MAG: UvrD-helicase domain-containing protein [Anaerolineales bacterium]|jgi:hypothetical protein